MLRCCFFSKRHLKESRNFGIPGFDFLFFCQLVKSFQHGECKQEQTTKIARLRKLLGNLLCDMVLGSGIPICKQVNCNLEGKLYVPMDSIKRIREDSNLKLRIRVRSGSRIRANSGRIRIRANSCEFEPASLVPVRPQPLSSAVFSCFLTRGSVGPETSLPSTPSRVCRC